MVLVTITPVIVTNPLESNTCNALGVNPDALNDVSRGVGVVKNPENNGNTVTVTPPVNNSNRNGVGVKK